MITLKSPRELESMAHAGRIVGETLQLMRRTVRPGLTTEDLDGMELSELVEDHETSEAP